MISLLMWKAALASGPSLLQAAHLRSFHCFPLGVAAVIVLHSVAQSCPTLCDPPELQPTRLLCPWDFPGMTAGVRCHFLLQDIFLTQGLKPESLESPALAGGFYTTNLGCNTLSILLALFHLCSNSMPTYAQSKRPGVMHQHAEKGTILFLNPHSLLPGSLASLC